MSEVSPYLLALFTGIVIPFLVAGLFWLTKLLWRIGTSTANIDSRLDKLNGSISEHMEADLTVQGELSKSLAALQGRNDERREAVAERAVAAAVLVSDAASAAAKLIQEAKEKTAQP